VPRLDERAPEDLETTSDRRRRRGCAGSAPVRRAPPGSPGASAPSDSTSSLSSCAFRPRPSGSDAALRIARWISAADHARRRPRRGAAPRSSWSRTWARSVSSPSPRRPCIRGEAAQRRTEARSRTRASIVCSSASFSRRGAGPASSSSATPSARGCRPRTRRGRCGTARARGGRAPRCRTMASRPGGPSTRRDRRSRARGGRRRRAGPIAYAASGFARPVARTMASAARRRVRGRRPSSGRSRSPRTTSSCSRVTSVRLRSARGCALWPRISIAAGSVSIRRLTRRRERLRGLEQPPVSAGSSRTTSLELLRGQLLLRTSSTHEPADLRRGRQAAHQDLLFEGVLDHAVARANRA
jgi:hypothetical protein